VAPASQGLLGRIQRANDDASHRFGPHTAEVEAFIAATFQLTPWQWRQVLAIRRLVASVSKEGAGPADSTRSIQAAIRSSERRISEPIARAGEVLFDTLAKRNEEKQIAAWQAMTALVIRSQLPALKFAVHYAPFAGFIPLAGSDVLDPRTRRFIETLPGLTKEQLAILARRWRIEPGVSRALLQAVAKNRHVKSEETVALAALAVIPNQATGDEGWSAVRTAVHGGRVLGALGELSSAEITVLWAPLEEVVPLASLSEVETVPAAERVRSAVNNAIKTITRPPRARVVPPAARVAAAYGPNHAEAAAFIKGAAELSPIQWLRVLDRRKLVASVTREGTAEPAGVVRSILAALTAWTAQGLPEDPGAWLYRVAYNNLIGDLRRTAGRLRILERAVDAVAGSGDDPAPSASTRWRRLNRSAVRALCSSWITSTCRCPPLQNRTVSASAGSIGSSGGGIDRSSSLSLVRTAHTRVRLRPSRTSPACAPSPSRTSASRAWKNRSRARRSG